MRKIQCFVVPPKAPDPEDPTEDGLYAAIGWDNRPEHKIFPEAMFPWRIRFVRVSDGQPEWERDSSDPASALANQPDVRAVYLISLDEMRRQELERNLKLKDIELVELVAAI